MFLNELKGVNKINSLLNVLNASCGVHACFHSVYWYKQGIHNECKGKPGDLNSQ